MGYDLKMSGVIIFVFDSMIVDSVSMVQISSIAIEGLNIQFSFSKSIDPVCDKTHHFEDVNGSRGPGVGRRPKSPATSGNS